LAIFATLLPKSLHSGAANQLAFVSFANYEAIGHIRASKKI